MRDKGDLPLVAFSLNNHANFTLFDLADKLRNRGWIVPAYNCPEGANDMVSCCLGICRYTQDSCEWMYLEYIAQLLCGICLTFFLWPVSPTSITVTSTSTFSDSCTR